MTGLFELVIPNGRTDSSCCGVSESASNHQDTERNTVPCTEKHIRTGAEGTQPVGTEEV